MFQVLVVEDDCKLNKLVCDHLRWQHYDVAACTNVTDAVEKLRNRHFDIVISDIILPGRNGYDLVKILRQVDQNVPILLMTVNDDLRSKQKGFEVGIDDYMVKPINLDELVWRIQALLRRANIKMEQELVVGKLVMDRTTMQVTVENTEIRTTVREFEILYKLLSYPKRIFSRDELLDEFWGLGSRSGLRSVDVYITRIREKFTKYDEFQIETVYGLGYKAMINS